MLGMEIELFVKQSVSFIFSRIRTILNVLNSAYNFLGVLSFDTAVLIFKVWTPETKYFSIFQLWYD